MVPLRRRIAALRRLLRRRYMHWAAGAMERSAEARVVAAIEAPLRAALFNTEQMRTHARLLAASHRPSTHRRSANLLRRLDANARVLRDVHFLLAQPVEPTRRMSPAAEWLLDNYYLIEDQISQTREHLPPGYLKELPWIESGAAHSSVPRVYDMALAVVSHGDGRVDPDTLRAFVSEYQTVALLRLGELWAIPIMLRLALIENLRRVAGLAAAGRAHRNLADTWAQRFFETATRDARNMILTVADLARSSPPLNSAFVAELARRLQGQGAALALPLTWIDQQLSATGLSIEQLVQLESQRQAANQLSISNCIGSLRMLGSIDWREFVEEVSKVESLLREGGDAAYALMDFGTRDRYRHVIERLARRSKLTEPDIASLAVRLAQQHDNRHVGYWLIGDGQADLESAARARRGFWRRLCRSARRHALGWYAGFAIVTSLAAGSAVTIWMARYNIAPGWLAAIAVLSTLTASQAAIDLVNWLMTLVLTPVTLPRMDYRAGVPAEARTLIAVPTILGSLRQISALIDALEIRFLGNRDDNLHFALVTDWPDSGKQRNDGEDELLDAAASMIDALNRRYRSGHGSRFFLLHRPRSWNEAEGCWMGWERKRGKLANLNALLRGGDASAFERVAGDIGALDEIKYVITLDTDTELPRDAAWQMIGTMAHPLNRPVISPRLNRVTSGYGILQPRVSISASGGGHTLFAKLFGSVTGIDPYTRAVSDVYQDLFHEGSFIGKGIYDVDAVVQTLQGRLPDNRILSHDLLEGCYARSGLVSDVQLYERFPQQYSSDVSRRHRWIRGDWQIARWLCPKVPLATPGRKERNPLSGLSRWKIFDNLRRSLVPASLLGMLMLNWLLLPMPLAGTLVLLGVMAQPLLLRVIVAVVRPSAGSNVGQHMRTVGHAVFQAVTQLLFDCACLPYEAYCALDAIVRSVVRMLATRRKLLEWRPSDVVESRASSDTNMLSRVMWFAPAWALAGALLLALLRPAALGISEPLLIVWFASPLLALRISRTPAPAVSELQADNQLFLRQCARRTWKFFESFVNAESNWLPPDNYQVVPQPILAQRTSPTNMGLALLANLTAADFGYLSQGQFLKRTADAFASMQKLERYHGHFYNWYDTRTLRMLAPLYVSTVDSGNLVAHLYTLAQGLRALGVAQALPPSARAGASDVIALLAQSAAELKSPSIAALSAHAADGTSGLAQSRAWLLQALALTRKVDAELRDRLSTEATEWCDALMRQCEAHLQELDWLAPWITLSTAIDDQRPPAIVESGLTLRRLADCVASLDESITGEVRAAIMEAAKRARARLAQLDELASQAEAFASADFRLLYVPARRLFSIGYNASDHRHDAGVYDLLASEARLATFVAITANQVSQESWFALNRKMVPAGSGATLVSWSGSMFEYLMPLLVMPEFPDTLLYNCNRAAVHSQIEYGHERGVPWGISESGYSTVDVHHNYQYRAFGVPEVGLMRGLADDLVIAPYASALALLVLPSEAADNLKLLAERGFLARYGYYEAVDYTRARLPRGESRVIVQSFMAHHQGMSLLAFAHVLLDRPMQRRFAAVPMFQAGLLLLQEKPAYTVEPMSRLDVAAGAHDQSEGEQGRARVFTTAATAQPEVQLLSNGRYHVMLTNSGSGYSRWRELAATRWREDSTRDNHGNYCFVRDAASGRYWSSTAQPCGDQPESYEVTFSDARVEFRRRDGAISTHSEIAVSPEDDVEVRRIKLHNHGSQTRLLEVTSYAEVVLQPQLADELHPAFGNLFVESKFHRDRQTLVCMRRPRSSTDRTLCLFHQLNVEAGAGSKVSYETDRARFIGRGRSLTNALAMEGEALSESEGSVLDPIVAIRRWIRLEPHQTVTLNLIWGCSDSTESIMTLVGKYQDWNLANRVFDLAFTQSQVALRHINASEADAQVYASLAGAVIFATASMRADTALLAANTRGQPALWPYSISGDLPIMLVRISDVANIDLVREALLAHAWWRLRGLPVDLVVINEDRAGYRQVLNDRIMGLAAASLESSLIDRPGGVFIRSLEQMAPDDRQLMEAVARLVFTDQMGTFTEQWELRTRRRSRVRLPPLSQGRALTGERREFAPPPGLQFYNGTGGFSGDGREYMIQTDTTRATPAPWVNVIANANFGTVLSENGSSYTWAVNSQMFRLTPWSNDPVSDEGGEAYYIRDDETGQFWSPMPYPCASLDPYLTRHGFGYSVFEHQCNDIRTETSVFVDPTSPVKYVVIKLKNMSSQERRLSTFGYVEWVLGDVRSKSLAHVVTEVEAGCGALYARNSFNPDFSDRLGFFSVSEPECSFSADRSEFIGRNGGLDAPAAMFRERLSNRVGAGLDPCGALGVAFKISAGSERQLVYVLGAAGSVAELRTLARKTCGAAAAAEALSKVGAQWRNTLSTIQVDTPDRALDLLINGWLPYQVLSCRFHARSGFYQSGGAIGFRDQLQDSMALVHSHPELVRAHLLRCAGRQFPEGDVQHWWHPPLGRGVRTHCSDDYLWLPYVTAYYVGCTGDMAVLDESVPFIDGPKLADNVESQYDQPHPTSIALNHYEHCVRAILYGLRFGVHGLPLMGSGDWNDGMNRVGHEGKGESVWLGFFLYQVLLRFAEVARLRGDVQFTKICQTEAARLGKDLEAHGWDGAWYRRAYFDNGEPLGSATNSECQIDSITQSWAVLSGAVDPEHARQAMEAVDQRLVQRDAALVRLLTPPFDVAPMDPGYIKGYLPGVRENGGQYTHAAIWATMAFAEMGDTHRAWELFGMINPINHALDAAAVARYKVEPYVVTADLYSEPPHAGRGGWSWYTGSAAWMYRLVIESLLGLERQAAALKCAPRLPESWQGFSLDYRYRSTVYRITVRRSKGDERPSVRVDAAEILGDTIALIDDGQVHQVEVAVPGDIGKDRRVTGKSSDRNAVSLPENVAVSDKESMP
jgi:cyclic beta-1,2-glucan synthetase